MWRQVRPRDHAYRDYLDIQLHRTLTKKGVPLQERTRFLIDKLEELALLPSASVLSVGCRNAAELEYFEQKEIGDVVGIDLFSEDPRISVMDMHRMTFSDDTFDIVYSSHSLEHARDVDQVASELTRVVKDRGIIAIEVPVQFQTRGADLVDFGDIASLHQVFKPTIETVLWTDQQPPCSPFNQGGSHVVRTIFSIRKRTRYAAW
jgi:SAM-dependent methyltransferase